MHIPKPIRQMLHASLLLMVSGHALSDWQADREAWVAGWRTGKVVQVEQLAADSASTSSACLPQGASQTTAYQQVTLRYTQTRRSRLHQVIVPTNSELPVGAPVRFNLQSCTPPQRIPPISQALTSSTS